MYHYQVKLLKVIDGDTVDVDVDLGFDVWMRNQRIRLHGIDTPESRTRDREEKRFGIRAKQHLSHMIATEIEHGPLVGADTKKQISLQSLGRGKFGRILGVLFVDGVNVNEKMIEDHHAVAYHGQSKQDIKVEHLKNRKRLTS